PPPESHARPAPLAHHRALSIPFFSTIAPSSSSLRRLLERAARETPATTRRWSSSRRPSTSPPPAIAPTPDAPAREPPLRCRITMMHPRHRAPPLRP
uniref:Uncharacterized protein n=1 Tax=Triticum urartu TaxID=4572 RepID=A0A8R7PS36_TRIUA